MMAERRAVVKELYRVSEAAAIFGVSRQTVYRWIRAKKIAVVRKRYGVFVPLSELEGHIGKEEVHPADAIRKKFSISSG